MINYYYVTDHTVITISVDSRDEAYWILCNLLKTPPEDIVLFDIEEIEEEYRGLD